jgi:DNA (cytosine-5)-methyltransferase 1
MTRASVRYPVISLFSGAMGLDHGLERAGLSIRAAVESNAAAVDTITANRPRLPVLARLLEKVPTAELLQTAGLVEGEPFVVAGGPSCQSFSTAGLRGSFADSRGTMFREFVRVVNQTRPRFFMMENVRGMLSAAILHRPLAQRGPGHPTLSAEEELGSAFRLMLRELAETNYYVVFDVLNAADYGTPQVRQRLIVLGSRDGEFLSMPPRTHARERANGLKPWVTLREALGDLEDPDPEFESIQGARAKLLRKIPPGGNWRSLPVAKRQEAIGSAFDSWGGRSGFLRRLDWDQPAPSVTSRPSSKATFMCHPDEIRPLSVAECARLQQFPSDWEFRGSLLQKYAQIGNAVPVGLGKALGSHLRRFAESGVRQRRSDLCGTVACASQLTLDRLAARPHTILNPQRMREVADTKSAREWLAKRSTHADAPEIRLAAKAPAPQNRRKKSAARAG